VPRAAARGADPRVGRGRHLTAAAADRGEAEEESLMVEEEERRAAAVGEAGCSRSEP
jgi:hypothetical protein